MLLVTMRCMASLSSTEQLHYETERVTQPEVLLYLSGHCVLIQGLCQSCGMVHAHSYASHMVPRQWHLSQAGLIIAIHARCIVWHPCWRCRRTARGAQSREGCCQIPLDVFRTELLVISQRGACLNRNVGMLPGRAAVCRGARLAHLPDAAVHRQRHRQVEAALDLPHAQACQRARDPAGIATLMLQTSTLAQI